MATKQVQKMRTTKTKTKTAITQKQSLDVVQTLLHGGLSSVAYLRAFFAEKAFDRQTYSAGIRVPSYQDYVNGKLPQNEDGSPITMEVLRRTRSRRVDKFLDWLEKGAFVALKEGRLSALRICVHPDSNHRDRVVETYTFTFKYHSDGRGGQVCAGLGFDSPGHDGITVEATSRALQDVLLHVMDVCHGLPLLPEQRFISMALFYPEDSIDFKVTNFETSTIKPVLFAQADGWEKRTHEFDLQSAFHGTSLKVSHLDHSASRGLYLKPDPDRMPPIPSRLEYVLDGTNEWDIINMLPPAAAESSGKMSGAVGRTISSDLLEKDDLSDAETYLDTPAPTGTVPAQPDQQDGQHTIEPALINASGVTSLLVPETINTQASDVPQMRTALQEMLRPEHISQGDTQTQALARPLRAVTPDPSANNRFATAVVKASASVRLELLPEVSRRLKKEKTQLKLKAQKLAGVKAAKLRKAGDVVLCQCGHGDDDGTMISCLFCQTRQHYHCYGYTGRADPRVPDEHACYQCLLGGRDDVLRAVRELALRRRAMSFAVQHGLVYSKEGLAESMGIPANVANDLLAYLLNEGFVTSPSGMRRSTRSAPNEPHYLVTLNGPTLDKLQCELFYPLTHIGDYYANTIGLSTAVTQQLRDLCSASVPPRATRTPPSPARNTTPSVSSRASLFPTSRAFSLHQREPLLKRPLDEDIFSTSAKRKATATPVYLRFKSVQTMDTLNADGLPSSPAM